MIVRPQPARRAAPAALRLLARDCVPATRRPLARDRAPAALLPLARAGTIAALLLLVLGGCAGLPGWPGRGDRAAARPDDGADALLDDVRQLTFAGRRTGEGYFSSDGRELVFQSEREPGNPFYQIYRMSLETGETRRISPGIGRTTCGWIHPDGERTLFASTHLDPEAEAKQAKEIAAREAGEARRYGWAYDPHYDLFVAHADGRLERLTTAHGYDAEASWSPDGRWIAFASNRHAYDAPLAPAERERLAEDPSYFIDLYLLDTRSGEIRPLTRTPGYDGGPFFSPDGERVVWRRFSTDGARAEIHSIRLDGSDERILTRLGVMSWAPYYHPSGDYVVFTTNRHGFDDFELYVVDALGEGEPVRVTTREGFDGLPVFSPDGARLVWTSNRTATGQSQLFEARWHDRRARARLGLPKDAPRPPRPPLRTRPEIDRGDLARHVRALTHPMTAGRRAGSPGEQVAADYLADAFARIGLAPAGDDGDYRHRFDFTSGVALGDENHLELTERAAAVDGTADEAQDATSRPLVLDRDWRPLAFSRSGEVEASPVVFAGYGLVAAGEGAGGSGHAIDDYAEVDVSDAWVLVFRDLPQSLEPEARQALQRHASLRYKAMIARDRGARGILFVSGPRGRFREELVPLRFDASLAGTRIAVVSLTDEAAEALLAETGRSLDAIQARTDARVLATVAGSGPAEGDPAFRLERVGLDGRIDLETLRAAGTNVIGRLLVGDRPSAQTVVLGAHFDHLGRGEGSSSLAVGEEAGRIHPGADDNASGTALLLELAESLVARKRAGAELGGRDLVFAAWSGEELGLLGSDAWVSERVNPHSNEIGPVAYLNFDMVGRLREHLVVQGLGSSPAWAALLEQAAAPLTLSVHPQSDSYVPTDATSFYTQGVPVLSAFTGVHAEYHTPRDTIERLDLAGTVQIGRLFERIALSLSRAEAPPAYAAQQAPSSGRGRSGFRVFLGTVPDYARTDVVGVALSGVAPAGPAEQAGLRAGDVIVAVDDRPIENLYDYTYALEALRVGEPARVTILRGGDPARRVELEVVPASRD